MASHIKTKNNFILMDKMKSVGLIKLFKLSSIGMVLSVASFSTYAGLYIDSGMGEKAMGGHSSHSSVGPLGASGVHGMHSGHSGGMHGQMVQVQPQQAPQAPASDNILFGGPASAQQRVVVQYGVPTEMSNLRGFADNVDLLTALKQVVPDGWRATQRGNVNLDQPVSWRGNRPWIQVLESLANEYKFRAEIDWGSRLVTIVGEAPAPEIPAVVHSIDNVSEWVLDPQFTLKENVTLWARKIGWSVDWAAADYPSPARTVLNGRFDAEGGPIHTLSLAYKDADQPLGFFLKSGNKTLRVENVKFSRPRQ